MRSSILVMLALCGTASADGGGYFIETVGAAAYHGDLARFSPFEARLLLGGGYVRGPWAFEASVTLFLPDSPSSSCGTAKCRTLVDPVDLSIANLDVRRAWRILRPRFTRAIGVDMVLHGGPRWAVCETPRDAYAGPGVGGGATVEMNLKAVSMFIDLGLDVAMLRGASGDRMSARLPYVGAGMRLGWF
jgi:hypothetical protein